MADAVVREWSMLPAASVAELRTWLLQYLVERPTLSRPVREKLTSAAAIMFKRAATECEDGGALITQCTQLFAGPPQQHFVALSLIGAVATEFGIRTESSQSGMTSETHIACKKRFEEQLLLPLFGMVLQLLQRYTATDGAVEEGVKLMLLDQGLGVCEQVLTWSFAQHQSQRQGDSPAASGASGRFSGGPEWQPILLGEGVVPVFVRLYQVLRMHESQAHRCQQCLIQLAGTAPTFVDPVVRCFIFLF